MPGMYQWQREYEAALIETDLVRLPKLIKVAEIVIDRRVEERRHPRRERRDCRGPRRSQCLAQGSAVTVRARLPQLGSRVARRRNASWALRPYFNPFTT